MIAQVTGSPKKSPNASQVKKLIARLEAGQSPPSSTSSVTTPHSPSGSPRPQPQGDVKFEAEHSRGVSITSQSSVDTVKEVSHEQGSKKAEELPAEGPRESTPMPPENSVMHSQHGKPPYPPINNPTSPTSGSNDQHPLPSTHFFHRQHPRYPRLHPSRATRLQGQNWGRSVLMMTNASPPSRSISRRLATALLRSSLPPMRVHQSRGRKMSPRLLPRRFPVPLCAHHFYYRGSEMTRRRGKEGVSMGNRSCRKCLSVHTRIAMKWKKPPTLTGVSVLWALLEVLPRSRVYSVLGYSYVGCVLSMLLLLYSHYARVDYQGFASENSEQLARAIERGIPSNLRGMVWQLM